jgi:hypothetical protein
MIKDFFVGCLVLAALAVLVPVLVVVFKVSLALAIPFGIAAAALVGVVVVGKAVRYLARQGRRGQAPRVPSPGAQAERASTPARRAGE